MQFYPPAENRRSAGQQRKAAYSASKAGVSHSAQAEPLIEYIYLQNVYSGVFMNASTEQTAAGSLMQRLKQETAAEHERMESLMQRSEAFASQENYAQFTLSQ